MVLMAIKIMLLLLPWIDCQMSLISPLTYKFVTLQQTTPMTDISPSWYTFRVQWSSEEHQIGTHSIIWAGYQVAQVNYYVSFRVFIDNITSTGAVLYYNTVSHSTKNTAISLVQFTIILLRQTGVAKVQLQNHILSPAILSVAPRSDHFQTYNFTSAFNLTDPSDYYCEVYISSFVSLVPDDNNQDFYIWTKDIVNNTIVVVLYSYFGSSNKIIEVNLTTLTIKHSAFDSVPFFNYALLYFYPTNPNVTTFQYADSNIAHNPVDSSCCILGLRTIGTFDISTDVISSILTLDTYDLTINLTQINLYQLYVHCFLECSSGYTKAVSSIYTCVPCSQAYQGCYLCSASACLEQCNNHMLNCYSCSSTSTCEKCLQGDIISGGCSEVKGCTRVQQVSPNSTSHISPCVQCGQEFRVVDQTCLCSGSDEVVVTGHCTSVYGCIATQRNAGVTTCTACNSSIGLSLNSSGQCVCDMGYQLTTVCAQICGDGILLTYQCDDGNVVSGDGCSSECSVQPLYRCQNGTSSTVSACLYTGDLGFSVQWMENTGNVNQGVISLSTASVGTLDNVNYTQGAIFIVDSQQVSIKVWDYSSGELLLYFDYEFTLQHLNSSLSIDLDPKYFDSSVVSYIEHFIVDSRGYELVYVEYSQITKLIQTAFFWIAIVIIILFLISIFMHPMIAVELITTYQAIFLLHFQTSHYTYLFSFFSRFTLIFGNPYYTLHKSSNLHYGNRGTFSYDDNNYTVTILTLLSGLILFLIAALLFKSLKYHLKRQFIWPITLSDFICSYGLSFALVVIVLSVDQSTFTSTNTQVSFGQNSMGLLAIVFLTIVMVLLVGLVMLKSAKRQKRAKYAYQPYQTYIKSYSLWICMVAVFLAITVATSASPYVVIPLTLLLTIFLMVKFVIFDTYQSRLHKAGILVNFTLIITLLVILLLRELFEELVTSQNETYMIEVLLLLMASTVVVTVCRMADVIYTLIRCSHENKIVQKEEQQVMLQGLVKLVTDQSDQPQKGNHCMLENQLLKKQILQNSEQFYAVKGSLRGQRSPYHHLQANRSILFLNQTNEIDERSMFHNSLRRELMKKRLQSLPRIYE